MLRDNQRMRLQGETISHSVIKTTKHLLVKMPNIPLFMADFFPRHYSSFLYSSFCSLESVGVADAVYIRYHTILQIVKCP